MVQVTIPIDFSAGYTAPDQDALIAKSRPVVSVELKPGAHSALSNAVAIGTVGQGSGEKLMAQIQFDYTWDPDAGTLTLSDATYDSPGTLALRTFPEHNVSAACIHRIHGGHFEADLNNNPIWSVHEAVRPGFQQACRAAAETALEALKQTLTDAHEFILHIRTPVPDLSAEDRRSLMMAYRNGVFLEAFDPEKSYPEDVTRVGIESVWGGTVTLNQGEAFANVIGSKYDPKIGGNSWLKLWRDNCNNGYNPSQCTSLGFPNGFCGAPDYVGGHVIAGQVASSVPKGSNAVYILPICKAHNNDDNIFMRAMTYKVGVWLKNYFGP